jgi:hypothetical protein
MSHQCPAYFKYFNFINLLNPQQSSDIDATYKKKHRDKKLPKSHNFEFESNESYSRVCSLNQEAK